MVSNFVKIHSVISFHNSFYCVFVFKRTVQRESCWGPHAWWLIAVVEGDILHSSRLNLKLSENSNKEQLPNMSSYIMEKAMTKEIQFKRAMTENEILFAKELNSWIAMVEFILWFIWDEHISEIIISFVRKI